MIADPFETRPPVWPIVFGPAADSALPVHLTVDSPPLVSRLRDDYRSLCGAPATPKVTYLTAPGALMRTVFRVADGDRPVCERCLAEWERAAENAAQCAVRAAA